MKMVSRLLAAALAFFVQADIGHAQTANGRATTAAPTYTNGSAQPLSLDLTGGLRVNCVTGCAAGSTAVNGQATTAAPSYTNNTPNPLSLDLTGNLRTTVTSGSIGISGGSVGLLAGSSIVGKVGIDQTTPGTTNGVQINAALPTGANTIGAVTISGTPTVTASGTVSVSSIGAGANNIGQISPATAPLTLNSSAILAASTNSTLVKNAAGAIYEISVYNSSATLAWLKLYNSASAPTCGSGTPVARYLIPGVTSGGAGSNVNISLGKAFTTGIAYCVTGLLADADTTATAAGTMTVNITYK